MKRPAGSILLGLLVCGLLAPPAVQAEDCSRELARARSALLRAQRSHARAGIAVLRINSELRSAGLSAAVPLAAGTEPASTAAPAADADVQALALAAWEIRRRTVERSQRALALMEPYEMRQLPDLELGPRLPDQEQELLKPAGEEAQSCRAWIFYAQRAAFRAEQSAQLAEVAADQAVALAKLERDKLGR
ncbi:MAG TPA: hypothetical protein VF414_01825 [Thermoanaerobaculia bacterium]